ncbi:MAG: amidohydrolase family protein [Firmicutes bacterium]|nr:amidohydrolase family protein [Bacillota bacterium]MCL2771403.1 amidohydrolase family protein [Bacillota bacterium]
MKIFDAHTHLPKIEEHFNFEKKKSILLKHLKEVNVVGAIVIADSEPTSPIGTPKECVELFKDTKNIFVMGAISPLLDFEKRYIEIEDLLKNKQIIAVKLFPGHEAFYLDDKRLEKVFKLCEKFDVPVAMHTGWENPEFSHPQFIAKIAKEHPKLKIVICHLYYPLIDLCYQITKEHKNVYYDISSIADEQENLEDVSLIFNTIAKENIDRIIFGTDYYMCSIADHIALVNSLDIKEEDKQKIFYDNAKRLYRLEI